MVKELNDVYAAQIGSKSMSKTYADMINDFSYRLLALFSYSKQPVSLRNHLNAQDCPLETDVRKSITHVYN